MLILPMAGLTPILVESIEIVAQPVPANVSGCWVTLFGRGGIGGIGGRVNNENQNTPGGEGAGGGARISRCFIPRAAIGDTYSLTLGTTGSRFARFTSGPVTLQAGWGGDGVGTTTTGVGGVASAVGFTDGVILANGGNGGVGGGSNAAGLAAPAVTNGAGAGGGGGGGSRSNVSGGAAGGLGGVTSGGDPVGVGNGFKGANGTHAGNGADGGRGGAGGGYTAATSTTVPGIAFTRVEWV